jgi:hypothetical protein
VRFAGEVGEDVSRALPPAAKLRRVHASAESTLLLAFLDSSRGSCASEHQGEVHKG